MDNQDLEYAEQADQEALEEEFCYLHAQPGEGLGGSGGLDDRRRELRKRTHALGDEQAPWALCLSGGGIRSATFGLGVLQGLAKSSLLTRFTYLSTVSGGGYIGSWLSRWILETGDIDRVQSDLKDGTPAAVAGEPSQVSGLRAFSNYLSPVWGFSSDFFTLVSIVLRNLLLNWCVLLPLIAALLLLPYLYASLLFWKVGNEGAAIAGVLAALALVVGIGYVVTDLPREQGALAPQRDRFMRLCFFPILLAAVLLSLALRWLELEPAWSTWAWAAVGSIVHLAGNVFGLSWLKRRRDAGLSASGTANGRVSWPRMLAGGLLVIASGAIGGLMIFGAFRFARLAFPAHGALPSDDLGLLYATACVPALLLMFWLATTVYVALARRWSAEGEREWWARSGGWWIRASLLWAGGFALVVYVPQWLLQTGVAAFDTKTLVAGGGLWGLATGLIGYWSKNGSTITRRARGFAELIGARLLDLAAVAFILALLVAFCFLLSNSIGKWVPEEVDRTPAGLLVRVMKAAQATEAAARANESVDRVHVEMKRLSGTKSATPVPEPLEKAATEVLERAHELQESAAALNRISPAEMSVAIDAIAKAKQVVVSSSTPLSETSGVVRKAKSETLVAIMASEHAIGAAVRADEPLARITPAEYSRRIVQAGPAVCLLFVFLLGVGWAFSLAVGVNTFSLHSMYGNRLVRAYLGAARPLGSRHPHWYTGFDNDDNVSMRQLQREQAPVDKKRLFHVLNLTLNLTTAANDRLAWQQRKAASFTVTPLRSGSGVVGYRPSPEYAGPEGWGITLARAMAISGAAASPNMGYHSSAAVAFVMTLFNVRLGWWLPNPGLAGRDVWRKSEPGTGSLRLLVDEALGVAKADQPYVYLSDGGHFENLGLYEMVKRRCRRILVVDASADPGYGYQDLQDAIRKIRVDFGIAIDFPPGSFAAPRRYTVGTIAYRDTDPDAQQDGVLCYLKPALFGDEPLDVQRYAAASRLREPNGAFPHQSTADQFFDEAQFESYRVLGAHMVAQMLAEREGCELPAQSAPLGNSVQNTDKHETGPLPAGNTGPLGKLADSARSMSQGAILASAITVGGVLGVSGTVALKDATVALRDGAEVSISQQSRDDLRNMKLQVEAPKLTGIEPDIDALKEWVERISRELDSASKSQQALADAVTQLGAVVDVIEKRVRTLETTQHPANNINGLVVAIEALTRKLESAFLRPDQKDPSRLDEITTRLKAIQDSIDGAPRRTVRGVEGAGR